MLAVKELDAPYIIWFPPAAAAAIAALVSRNDLVAVGLFDILFLFFLVELFFDDYLSVSINEGFI
jgi:hypothetical protein